MREQTFQDDVLFDRLVDGELSPVERRELLASLDDRPDGWRRCALAFLEAQSWAEDLGQFVRQPVTPIVTEDAKGWNAPRWAPSAAKTRRLGAGWLAIAAALLMALTLGLIWRGGDAPLALDQPNPDAQIAGAVPPPPLSEAENPADALTLWVRSENGQARPVHVPLVDAQTLDQQLGMQFQTGVPDNVRRQLQARGFDVQSQRRYAPLWLENGRPMIVPVEDTKIVPVSRNVY